MAFQWVPDPPWQNSPPTAPGMPPTIEQLMMSRKFLEDEKTKIEKEIDEKRHKKGRTYDFLTVFLLLSTSCFIIGPFAGFLYLQLLLSFLQKYSVLQHLVK